MHTIETGGGACGQKMCESMEKTMDRFPDDRVGGWHVSGFAAAGVYVSGGCPAHQWRRLFSL